MTAHPDWTVDGEALADLTAELLSFDTQNPPGDTRAIMAWVREYLEAAGLSPETIAEDPAKPNVVSRVPGERPETLLLLGHLDTVPYDAADWEYAPLGERVDDRMYGRGATDMKGPFAAMLTVYRWYAEQESPPPVTLEFAAVSDEEIGGDAGLPAVLDADVLDPDACIVGETTCGGGRHSISIADRGSIWLTIRGIGKAAHGSRPMFGDNAIDRLYDAIERIRHQVGTRTVEVPGEVAPILAESIEYYTNIVGPDGADQLFNRPTINLGTITGGDAINSVPAEAVAELDIRVPPGADTTEVLDELRDCIDGCDNVVVESVRWSIGTYVDPEEPIVQSVVTCAENITGESIVRRSSTGGSDAKRLRNREIPAVEFAFGTDTVHGVDEYTTVEALENNARTFHDIVHEWATTFE